MIFTTSSFLYFEYPEGAEAVNIFFSAMFCWNKDSILQYINSIKMKEAIFVAEGLMCVFSSDFSDDERKLYGKNCIMIIAYSPPMDDDSAVIMTYQQFFDVFLTYIKQYEDSFSRWNFKKICKAFDNVAASFLQES